MPVDPTLWGSSGSSFAPSPWPAAARIRIRQGTVPFKGTSTEGALDSLKDEMQKNMKNKAYLKRDDESGKPADASKGAGESKPAAESKPATKGG